MPDHNGTKQELGAIKERIPQVLRGNEGRCSPELLAGKLSVPLKLAQQALREFALLYECRSGHDMSGGRSIDFHFALPLRKRLVPNSLASFLTWMAGVGVRKSINVGLTLLLGLYGAIL